MKSLSQARNVFYVNLWPETTFKVLKRIVLDKITRSDNLF